jgi:hypothetical protein
MRQGELRSKPPMNDRLEPASTPLTLGDYPPSDTVRHLTPVDTRHFTEHYKMAGEDIMTSVGGDIQARAPVIRNVRDAKAALTKFTSEIRHHGRQSWIPLDLAAGGS